MAQVGQGRQWPGRRSAIGRGCSVDLARAARVERALTASKAAILPLDDTRKEKRPSPLEDLAAGPVKDCRKRLPERPRRLYTGAETILSNHPIVHRGHVDRYSLE